MSNEERKEFSGVLKYIRKWEGVTELKWADGGKKITAILGGAAVLIDYPSKALLFGARNDTNMHSLEVLPGNKLAVGTCGEDPSDGVWVYDTSRKVADQPIQKLEGLPSGHALVWDQTERTLWVAGTDVWPKTPEQVHGRLVGYQYPRQRFRAAVVQRRPRLQDA